MKVPREATRKRKRKIKYCIFLNCPRQAYNAIGLCCRHGGNPCQGFDKNGDKCTKSSRGVTKFCSVHKGGRRCQGFKDNGDKCEKGALVSTNFCSVHKGGRRCQGFKDNGDKCEKGALVSTNFCCAHKGGRRCHGFKNDGTKCDNGAIGITFFCKAHGGGKRCQFVNDNGDNCSTGAIGASGLCTIHGGNPCKYIDGNGDKCTIGAYGATGLCIKHGGGPRCQGFKNDGTKCDNGAIGASGFCSVHKGGRRCQGFKEDGLACDNSAQGSTLFCKAHGGGRRCQGFKEDGLACDNSAQGGYYFCKAHGGGRRCPSCIDWIDSRCGQKKYNGYCATCYHRLFPNTQRLGVRNYKTKELAVLCHLEQHFPTHHIVNDRRVSDGCSKKKPDFFFELLTHVIMVEVDEHGHMPYDKSCEEVRMMELSEDIAHRPLVFIRFNPDKTSSGPGCWGYDETGRAVVKKKRAIEWQERLAALTAKITFWLSTIPDKTVELIKLYY